MPREKTHLTRSECNSLCRRCVRPCRQPVGVLLIDCRRFQPFPFKISEHSFSQLELFADKNELGRRMRRP